MAQPLAAISGNTRFRFTAAREPKRTGPAWYAEPVRICARCSKPIPDAKRSHAKYCSDECKTQAFLARRRKKPEQVSVAVAGSPAEPEQKPSVVAGTVSPLGPAPTGAGNPDWYAMEYITTDPAGRRVRVRVQQRVSIEYLPASADRLSAPDAAKSAASATVLADGQSPTPASSLPTGVETHPSTTAIPPVSATRPAVPPAVEEKKVVPEKRKEPAPRLKWWQR